MRYEYERVATPAPGLRLHLNENTAGCSPRVIATLRRLTREQAAFYPDYDAAVAAVAARLAVKADELLLTNGLDEGILAASVAALRGSSEAAPFEVIVIVPAFDMYAACADAAGGEVVQIPLDDEFAFPCERICGAISRRTRLIFVTNPNNPTGQIVPKDSIFAIARTAPDALVFVDEAYADFSGHTLIGDPLLAAYPNVVVGRTFAKAYGLAALRAGAVVGVPETLARLRRAVPPYSLNVCAAIALPVALADIEYYDWYLGQVRQSKALLYDALDRLGVKCWPSAANFVLAHFGRDVQQIVAGLAARGIFIRDRSRDPGCAGCTRITTGIVEHTHAFVAALEDLLCGAA
jgi:histidinol-phosphate aminotransferase